MSEVINQYSKYIISGLVVVVLIGIIVTLTINRNETTELQEQIIEKLNEEDNDNMKNTLTSGAAVSAPSAEKNNPGAVNVTNHNTKVNTIVKLRDIVSVNNYDAYNVNIINIVDINSDENMMEYISGPAVIEASILQPTGDAIIVKKASPGNEKVLTGNVDGEEMIMFKEKGQYEIRISLKGKNTLSSENKMSYQHIRMFIN